MFVFYVYNVKNYNVFSCSIINGLSIFQTLHVSPGIITWEVKSLRAFSVDNLTPEPQISL